jgi:hypothetical protein
MATHLDEMKRFITISGNNGAVPVAEKPTMIIESIIDQKVCLLEEIEDLRTRMENYQESDNSEYSRGIEQGFSMAVIMLEQLLERFR